MLKDSMLSQLIPSYLLEDTQYRYELMTEQHVDQVVDVFTHAFCHSEPMTHYLNMDEEKFKIFARSVAEKAAHDQLSFVTLDNERVIAFALVEDIAAPGAIPDFDPKFKYIIGLLEQLGENFFAHKKFPCRKIAHLFITAVDEQYRHRSLSKQVNFRVMQLAAQKGFDFVYCEFTHYYNEKGIVPYLKLPIKLIGSATYADFVYQGMKPFEYLNGGANAYLWAVRANAILSYEQNHEKVIEHFT
jgi:hypothetical protein